MHDDKSVYPISFKSKFLTVLSLKNPLDTSFIIPSPPIVIIVLKPFSRKLLAILVPSPDFSVKMVSISFPKYFFKVTSIESQFFPVRPPLELG